MQCKQCQRQLWNVPERECPGCGTRFLPSEFQFAPNSVRFSCPHCDLGYVGTQSDGHLEPAEFDCQQCGHHIHMDEMTVRQGTTDSGHAGSPIRCPKCNYPLSHLASRTCPECGTPFLPSDFRFLPNSVDYACPHCDRRYCGNDENGHLSPTAFDCGGCGQHIEMDEMVVLPRVREPRHPGRPMRCTKCEYRLWSLSSRQCPECGTPFRPSDFEFVPNSVEFACPHCSKRYYGTGPSGHLSPSEFACVGCQQHIHMDDMVLFPAAGVDEEQTGGTQAVWLERKRRGFFRSWFSTIGSAMVAPGRLIKSVPVESSLLTAWWFALLIHIPVVLFGFSAFMIMPFAVGVGGAGMGLAGALGAGLGVALPTTFVVTSISIALWGAVTHGMLRLTAQPVAGARRTYQAICYSAGANIIAAVPMCGAYTCAIWWIISAVIMVKEGQRVSGWKASISVLLLPVLSFLSIAGFYVWAFTSVMSQTSALGGQAEAAQITRSLRDYADDHEGQLPAHAAHLIADGYLKADAFVMPNTNTRLEDVNIAGVTLAQFELWSSATQGVTAAKAAADLPEGTIAHRLGDFVFTYHGIDPYTTHPRLWLVVTSPDPDTNAPPGPSPFHVVGRADGNYVHVTSATMTSPPKQQNWVRASKGLPPLPDPATVTHDAPAVAPKPESDTSP